MEFIVNKNNIKIDILKSILNKIRYGLRDPKTNKQWIRHKTESEDYTIWRLGTAKETITAGVGICWDTVELIRIFLNYNEIQFKIFYSQTNTFKNPTHTFVLFKDGHVWKWIEGSWETYRNNNLIFKSWLEGAKYISNLLEIELDSNYKYSTYLLKKYPKPGCNASEFINFCLNQKIIF
jgi:hypothetical protein